MEQTIIIGIYIGLRSACAAIALHGNTDRRPTVVVTWPRSPIVPLQVRLDSEGGIEWGHTASTTESYKFCGLSPELYYEGSNHLFIQELRRKHGKHYYHNRLRANFDPEHASRRFMSAFAEHIRSELQRLYGSTQATVKKQIHFVIPSYLEKLHFFEWLDNFFRRDCQIDIGRISMSVVPQIHAALRYSDEMTKISFSQMDGIIMCLMEEEIVTITTYEVVSHSEDGLPLLRRSCETILTTGSHDIGENFQRFVERQLLDQPRVITSTSGIKILNESAKAREKFLSELNGRNVNRPERFRIGSLGRVEISQDEMRNDIFNPVLTEIFCELHRHLTNGRASFLQRHLIFSGVLAECPYVHSFIHSKLENFEDLSDVIIIRTQNESTSSCEGAVLNSQWPISLDRDNISPTVKAALVQLSRIYCHQPSDDELFTQHQTTDSEVDNHQILRRYEMILAEKSRCQGFDIKVIKHILLSTESIYQVLGMPDAFTEECKRFSHGYLQEKVLGMDAVDKRRSFNPLHMAAAYNDPLALHIALKAGCAVQALVPGRPLGGFNHTPLHICVWYNSEANECVKELIAAGADALENRYESPADIATVKGHMEVLEIFRIYYGERFAALASDLLQLAMALKNKEIVNYFIKLGGADIFQQDDSMMGYYSSIAGADIDYQPALVTALSSGWVEEAMLIIARRMAISTTGVLHFDSRGSGEEAMKLLLDWWADLDATAKDEWGRTPLWWSARLGYDTVVQQLVQKGELDARDNCRKTPLLAAAEFGHEAVVRVLLESGADVNAKTTSQLTALHSAAASGQTAIMRLLLKEGIGRDVNAKTASGCTALHYAAQRGHEAVVKLLLENGANYKAKATDGRTALCFATENNHAATIQMLLGHEADVEMKVKLAIQSLDWAAERELQVRVRTLLDAGVDISLRDPFGYTALHEAATRGDETVVRLLLENGADITVGNKEGATALHIAAQNGRETVARSLLEKNAYVNSKDHYDKTPLFYSMTKDCEGVVRLLLEKGAYINMRDQFGNTVLHKAAADGDETIVRLLLDNGADITVENRQGKTALHEASRAGRETMVQLLLEKGAYVNSKDHGGQTPLLCGVTEGREDTVVKLLVEKGADINVKDRLGYTALHKAATDGDEAIVRLLLENGADMNVKDQRDETALHKAVRAGRETVVQLLLEKGAYVNSKDRDGQTPLLCGMMKSCEGIVKLLLQKGADINVKDRLGYTALHKAATRGDETVVRLLLENGADITAENWNGETVLSEATRRNNQEILQLLMEAQDQGMPRRYKTALHWFLNKTSSR